LRFSQAFNEKGWPYRQSGHVSPSKRGIASEAQARRIDNPKPVTAAQIESALALGQNPLIQFDNPVCDAPLLRDIDLQRRRFGARIELPVLWP